MNENTQYWINQDGVQQGPLTIEQIKAMSINETAYVWSVGFDDWRPIAQVPELAAVLTVAQQAAEAVPNAVETSEQAPLQPQSQVRPQGHVPAMPAVQPVSPQGQPYPPCPPTNMVWAIISTVLCCIPTGIVALYYSNKVSKKYYEGDQAAAEHYSEVSAWWCIATIIAGIVMSPLVSLIQMSLFS